MRFWSSPKGCNRQPRKNGKASDCNGVRAEDIEACSEKTKEMTRQIFNEILKEEDCTPTTWRRIRIKVIHKKGRCGRGRKLHANMHSASALQALFDVFVQSVVPETRSCATRRPRVGSGDHSRRWTTWRDGRSLSRSARSGVSKCGSRRWIS